MIDHFWRAAAAGRLLLRRCTSCKVLEHPAQATDVCGGCHGTEFEDVLADGRGRVYTWILSRHPNRPDEQPRIVAVIELEEGVRLVSNVIDVEPQAMRNELPVEVCFVERDGRVLPQFRPLTGEPA
jgi:uncharacterized protein